MKLKTYVSACTTSALLALTGVASAQTSDTVPDADSDRGNTLIILTPPNEATGEPGSTAVFTPLPDRNRPMTREEVKAGAPDAASNGGTPRGEVGPEDMSAHGEGRGDYEMHKNVYP